MKKKRSQLVATELSHYYSSTDDEPPAPISKPTKKKGPASKKKVASAPPAVAPIADEEGDLEIVKEVPHSATQTLRQMAEAAKRRPGLCRNS